MAFITYNQLNGCNLHFLWWFQRWFSNSWFEEKKNHPNDQIPLPCSLPYGRREKWKSSYVQVEVYFDFINKISILSHIPWPVGWPIFLSANGPTSMKTAICRWLRFIHFVLQVSMHDSCSKLEWGEERRKNKSQQNSPENLRLDPMSVGFIPPHHKSVLHILKLVCWAPVHYSITLS